MSRVKPNGNTKQKCIECALANTPENVHLIRIRRNLSGRAYIKEHTMAVPRPFTRRALQLFLHECGHFVLHSKGRKKRYIEEYEAEQWSFQKMRDAGIPIPKKSKERAKGYVARKIGQAYARGLIDADPKIRKWATQEGRRANEG